MGKCQAPASRHLQDSHKGDSIISTSLTKGEAEGPTQQLIIDPKSRTQVIPNVAPFPHWFLYTFRRQSCPGANLQATMASKSQIFSRNGANIVPYRHSQTASRGSRAQWPALRCYLHRRHHPTAAGSPQSRSRSLCPQCHGIAAYRAHHLQPEPMGGNEYTERPSETLPGYTDTEDKFLDVTTCGPWDTPRP